MYSNQLIEQIITQLAPDGFVERQVSEANYPDRNLPEEAIVTRSAPSPTGFLHIGTVYMSLVNKLVAHQSKGVNMLRIEDTDKKREVTDGIKTIVSHLDKLGLKADEGVDESGQSYGQYGPYLQSQRAAIYLGFAIDLLRQGRAYLCFATPDELDANYKQQQAAKVRPGYYGQYALWRDRSETEVVEALNQGRPFVLRFKSQGSHQKRITIKDILKGEIELPENDLDVPLIKSDDSRLPTYHLAHVVDDYLMKTTIILRGDEWLPSTPLHIELAEALNIKPFSYAHFAPINIMDGSSKRKLSKRKDPQADIAYFYEAGYPKEAILEYLLRLANSNYEDWRLANPDSSLWDFPFSFEKWSKARGALLDMAKLDDVSKDWIARLSQPEFVKQLRDWASQHASYLETSIKQDEAYANKVLAVEREGDQARKDLAKWSDAPEQYGYFFDDLFTEHFATRIQSELEAFSSEDQSSACLAFLEQYDPEDDQTQWFDKLKLAAEKTGFAVDNKVYKADPGNYKGNLADYAKIIRVRLTGKNRTPDLWTIMKVMGSDRVKQRLTI